MSTTSAPAQCIPDTVTRLLILNAIPVPRWLACPACDELCEVEETPRDHSLRLVEHTARGRAFIVGHRTICGNLRLRSVRVNRRQRQLIPSRLP